jgi:hypothetical protein
MGTYCSNELHTTYFNDLVVNELENAILLEEVLQEVEAIVAKERQAKEKP